MGCPHFSSGQPGEAGREHRAGLVFPVSFDVPPIGCGAEKRNDVWTPLDEVSSRFGRKYYKVLVKPRVFRRLRAEFKRPIDSLGFSS